MLECWCVLAVLRAPGSQSHCPPVEPEEIALYSVVEPLCTTCTTAQSCITMSYTHGLGELAWANQSAHCHPCHSGLTGPTGAPLIACFSFFVFFLVLNFILFYFIFFLRFSFPHILFADAAKR